MKIMLLIVKQCIFNQTQGYWLFFDALNVVLSIIMCIHNQIEQLKINSIKFLKGDFEFKLWTFCMQMMAKVWVALVPLLSFAFTYSVSKAHNMFVLMLDLHFKSLNVVENICKENKSHTNCGGMWHHDFDATINGIFFNSKTLALLALLNH